jgi:energy-coupling factor transport system substrate-specific component
VVVRLAALAAAAALAATPAGFLHSRQGSDGGFAEPGGRETVGLTAWAALGLRAAGAPTGAAAEYLAAHESDLQSTTDVALGVLAESALGKPTPQLLARLRGASSARTGRIGPTVNSTIWGAIALRQAGLRPPARTARWLLARQRPSGGWPWFAGGQADSNDTAAAIEALRALGVGGRPIVRGLAFLRRLQNRDGGFELTAGRGSDAQSTAWAIQAFLAAGRRPGAAAFRYLARLRRPDGSYRYTARYATTPVWVTAQVLPALARKPFPLR